MAKINPIGKSLKSPKLPIGRSSLPLLPTRNTALNSLPENFENEGEDGEIDEQAMAAQLAQAQQQRRNQIKQQTGQAVKKAGQQAGQKAGAALAGPIGGVAGRMLGGFAGKMAGKKAGDKLADAAEKQEIDASNESAQADSLSLKKNAALKLGKLGGGGDTTEILKTVAKEQLKKKWLWYILPWIPVATVTLVIGLGLGLILYCFVSVYSCTQKKGLAWTIWNTYQGGFTELLRESFSNTCMPDTSATKNTEPAPAAPNSASPQSTGATDPEVKSPSN